MKANFFSFSYVLILIASLVKFSSDAMPFIKGKYIYWLLLLTIVAFVFVLKNKSKKINITSYDILLALLATTGVIHFTLISKTTIYAIPIWNYIGYFTLYFLLRNLLKNTETNSKVLTILLCFLSITALINVFWMFLQWLHWIPSSNQFFLMTGIFFSPNQLGIYLSIGCISSLFLMQKAKTLGLKIGLRISLLLILAGLSISESRGALISLCVALIYYFYHSRDKMRQQFNWKIYLGIGVFFISSFYYITVINKNKADSTSGRYFTTQQVVKQIIKNPFGYGVNSFSTEYNKSKAQYFEKNADWEEMKNAGYVYNANNDLLELTFEQGVLWSIVFIGFLLLLFRKSNTIESKISKTIIICLLVFSLTNNILTLPVFALIACICTVLIINTTDAKVIYELENKMIYKFAGIGFVLLAAFVQINCLNAEYKLQKLYEGKMYLKGENQLQSYVLKTDNKGEELFMAGVILVKNGYKEEGIECMKDGFERSGKPTLGRILANGLKKQKKYAEAEKIFNYNKNVEPYRFEARMDLLDLFIVTKQNEKAKKMAQEILQLPVKIPSKTIIDFKKKARLYINEK